MLSLKKIFKVGALLGFAGLTLLLAGCGGESPADVAVAFYQAANRGDYAKAESYLDPTFRMTFELGVVPFPKVLDAVTKKRSIERIEVILNPGEEDGTAYVSLRLRYTDGSQTYDILGLRKADKQWKIFTSNLLASEFRAR